MLLQIGGKVFLNYNLGSKDITIGDIATKVNDGRYHVVRFTRSDINSTLQVDDNPAHSKFPTGNLWSCIENVRIPGIHYCFAFTGNKQQIKTTVFNDQSLVQIGGRFIQQTKKVDRPFVGIMAGIVYNSLKPLELVSV